MTRPLFTSAFESVLMGPIDPMYDLKVACDNDTDIKKVDLGVGVYRTEDGMYNEMVALKEAKAILAKQNPGHDYEVSTGNPAFVQHAAEVIFGQDSSVLGAGRIASAQTISGTGAIHVGVMLLNRVGVNTAPRTFYIGTPTWGNYQPLCELAGAKVAKYRYLTDVGSLDFDSLLCAVGTAPSGSVFVLQGCCHNPTATDLSEKQWRDLGEAMLSNGQIALFDIAYQGLGEGIDEDAYGIRHFAMLGIDLVVGQSFSKNFGLYGERVGAVHVLCPNPGVSRKVKDQLRCLNRWEISSPPAYGARLVEIILSNPQLKAKWLDELNVMRLRLRRNRQKLYDLLVQKQKLGKNWDFILNGKGLFSILPLDTQKCHDLSRKYHIHLVPNGRITVSGLNDSNLEYVADCMEAVIRSAD